MPHPWVILGRNDPAWSSIQTVLGVSREKLVLISGLALALFGFWGAPADWLKGVAVMMGSGCVSYATAALLLRQDRERAARAEAAEAYLQFLRHMDEIPIQPSLRPASCRGCRHYHGKHYGGVQLVCAMHPHGVEGEDCADWNWGADQNGEWP